MSEDQVSSAAALLGEAVALSGDERRKKAAEAADKLRVEMEQLALEVRDLMIPQPPLNLLGFMLSKMFSLLGKEREEEATDTLGQFQFALEYAHAVWSCHKIAAEDQSPFDEKAAETLLDVLEALRSITSQYSMAHSLATKASELGVTSSDMQFQAQSAWVSIRGHRYQVLEQEFFSYVLSPHDTALREVYGVGAQAIAEGIQAFANSFRLGIADAFATLQHGHEHAKRVAADRNVEIDEAIALIKAEDPERAKETEMALKDAFLGGICNLSRHTALPNALLEDLAFEPGSEREFFAEGHFCGTPLRTLPARIRPLVNLNGEYYATDGQFVRDAAYRAIQRGVLARRPDYKETWNKRQKELVEKALDIFSSQLVGAQPFHEVFYPDQATGQWAETDLVVIIDDVLLVAEAKAGVAAMHSPVTNFNSHARAIKELVLKAYQQCQRFLSYVASKPVVPLFRLVNGAYIEVAKIRRSDFRLIVPLGLTVENFSPFSAMCKEISEVTPILGQHPFISMSVDDLFVLTRFLPSAGALLHYLEVRQQVAGIRGAKLFDELDHLGAYISQNRFDQSLRKQLTEVDGVWWDAFSETVDKYFSDEDWQAKKPPQQEFPAALLETLEALDRTRRPGWLKVDTAIRNLGSNGRSQLATTITQLASGNTEFARRAMLFGDDQPMQIWISRENAPPVGEIQHYGEVGCLVCKVPTMLVMLITTVGGEIRSASATTVRTPSMLRLDYYELVAEAAKYAKQGSPISAIPARRLRRRDRK